MTGVTFLIFAVFAVPVLIVRPATAVGLLIASMLVWPEYLRIPMGPALMSAPRLIALVLLMRLIVNRPPGLAPLHRIDVLVFAGWLWTLIATFATGSETWHVSQMIGRVFDTVLMYAVARLAFVNPDDWGRIALPLALTTLFMTAAGVLETLDVYHLYANLEAYRPFEGFEFEKGDEYRLGLLRAKASLSVHIYFGMAMVILAGVHWSMRSYARYPLSGKTAALIAAVGALTSMSSGPWLALAVVIILNSYYYYPRLIKPSLIGFALFCGFLETASNRHFYYLIDYLALDGGTAWYRARLLEVAVAQLHEYWLVGYGAQLPNHWGALIDGRLHLDVVNQFVVVALYGGLPALIALVWSHGAAVRRCVVFWRRTEDIRIRQVVFGLAAALISLDFASMSVSLYGPPLLMSYVLLGLCAGACNTVLAVKPAPRPNLFGAARQSRFAAAQESGGDYRAGGADAAHGLARPTPRDPKKIRPGLV
jgi:hypothetical protein